MPVPQTHPVLLSIDSLLRECDVKRTRASGPGGQHRNKVETAIVITHRPSGVVGQASESRNQERNRKIALQRLRTNLALAIRLPFRSPSALWQSRIKGRKVNVAVDHADFAALLCESLNCLESFEFDVSQAAETLGISTSQLVKFLKAEPVAYEWLNRERQKRDLHKMH